MKERHVHSAIRCLRGYDCYDIVADISDIGHTMLGGHEVGAIEAECEEVATRAAAAAPKLPRSRLTRDTRAAATTIKLIKRGGGRRHMRRQIAENRRVSAAVFGELISSAHTAAASPGLLGDLGTHSHIPAGSCGCRGWAGARCVVFGGLSGGRGPSPVFSSGQNISF